MVRVRGLRRVMLGPRVSTARSNSFRYITGDPVHTLRITSRLRSTLVLIWLTPLIAWKASSLKPCCAFTFIASRPSFSSPVFTPCSTALLGHNETKIVPRRLPSVELDWVCSSRCVFLAASRLGLTPSLTYYLDPYNTFDGPGFPACRDVAKVYSPNTVEEAVSIVKDASDKGLPVRASGVSSLFPPIFFRPCFYLQCYSRMAICGVSVFSHDWRQSTLHEEMSVDDTMCSDDPRTIIVKTENLNRISDLVLNGDKGTVVVEGGVTFSQV